MRKRKTELIIIYSAWPQQPYFSNKQFCIQSVQSSSKSHQGSKCPYSDAVVKGGRKAMISTTDRKLIWNIQITWIYSGTNEAKTRAE